MSSETSPYFEAARKSLQEEVDENGKDGECATQDSLNFHWRVIDQERQRALLQMACGIAHDFNNSLASILGYSDLLVNDPDAMRDEETVCRYLNAIHNAACHATETVRRMRKFYRPRDEQEEHNVLDLCSLVEEAVDVTLPLWKHQAEAHGIGIKIEKDLSGPGLVCGNAFELHEVVINLIINAVDAMQESGILSLRIKSDAELVTLEVQDTGCGMPEEIRRKCLDPFFTTKGEAGSGLGLAIVQGVMRRHSGVVSVDSNEGEGTTVRLDMPVAQASIAPSEQAAARPRESTLQPRSILVVEDDPDLHELLRTILEDAGHSVDIAGDPGDGLQKFHAGWYDLVITSRAMPGMSGDKLAKVIKAISIDKPVIMFTGYGDIMSSVGDMPPAVDVVLAKPITVAKLLGALDEALTPGDLDPVAT